MKKLLLVIPLVLLLCFTFSCQQPTEEAVEKGLTEEEVSAIIGEIIKIWNNADMAAVEKVYSADIVYSDPLSGETVGIDAFKEMVQTAHKERTSINLSVGEIFLKDDKLVALWTANETLLSGAKLDVSGISIIHIVDGKAVKETVYYDTKKVLEQMGFKIVPPEEPEEK
jgi:ketosteroid isomerase-like protein